LSMADLEQRGNGIDWTEKFLYSCNLNKVSLNKGKEKRFKGKRARLFFSNGITKEKGYKEKSKGTKKKSDNERKERATGIGSARYTGRKRYKTNRQTVEQLKTNNKTTENQQ
jgi:hypothetical protein